MNTEMGVGFEDEADMAIREFRDRALARLKELDRDIAPLDDKLRCLVRERDKIRLALAALTRSQEDL